MSLGLRSFSRDCCRTPPAVSPMLLLLIGIPSIITSGWLSPVMVLWPRICMYEPAPGSPEEREICTPAALPARPLITPVSPVRAMAIPVTFDEEAPCTSLFCSKPRAVTVTSISILVSVFNLMSKTVWLPMGISWVVIPIKETTKTPSVGGTLSEKLPLRSAFVPMFVPFSSTLTPGSPVPLSASVIFPEILRVCPCVFILRHPTNKMSNNCFIVCV